MPASGRIKIGGVTIGARDGVAISDTRLLTIEALDDCEVVLVDVA
ncbi:pirin family protein [Rhizobium binxianense]